MADTDLGRLFLDSAIARFQSLKRVGERAIEQVSEHDLGWAANRECNSIRIQVQHLHGNLVSRWTDTLTTDGEKSTRDRDKEFVSDELMGRGEIMAMWEEGWGAVMTALASFTPADLAKTICIRGEAHSLVDAINRSLMHVAYHVGQIVQIAKERVGERWQNLSIARGQSGSYTSSTSNVWTSR